VRFLTTVALGISWIVSNVRSTSWMVLLSLSVALIVTLFSVILPATLMVEFTAVKLSWMITTLPFVDALMGPTLLKLTLLVALLAKSKLTFEAMNARKVLLKVSFTETVLSVVFPVLLITTRNCTV